VTRNFPTTHLAETHECPTEFVTWALRNALGLMSVGEMCRTLGVDPGTPRDTVQKLAVAHNVAAHGAGQHGHRW
jgi:hypothetical protein